MCLQAMTAGISAAPTRNVIDSAALFISSFAFFDNGTNTLTSVHIRKSIFVYFGEREGSILDTEPKLNCPLHKLKGDYPRGSSYFQQGSLLLHITMTKCINFSVYRLLGNHSKHFGRYCKLMV